jgi:hypothetical protein
MLWNLEARGKWPSFVLFSIFKVGNSGFWIMKIGNNYQGEYNTFFISNEIPICILSPPFYRTKKIGGKLQTKMAPPKILKIKP